MGPPQISALQNGGFRLILCHVVECLDGPSEEIEQHFQFQPRYAVAVFVTMLLTQETKKEFENPKVTPFNIAQETPWAVQHQMLVTLRQWFEVEAFVKLRPRRCRRRFFRAWVAGIALDQDG